MMQTRVLRLSRLSRDRAALPRAEQMAPKAKAKPEPRATAKVKAMPKAKAKAMPKARAPRKVKAMRKAKAKAMPKARAPRAQGPPEPGPPEAGPPGPGFNARWEHLADIGWCRHWNQELWKPVRFRWNGETDMWEPYEWRIVTLTRGVYWYVRLS